LDNDKDFSTKVLTVIKNNLFEIKKSLFNLEDCVSKKDFDALQQNFDAAQNSLKNLQSEKAALEYEIASKESEIEGWKQQSSTLREEILNLQNELSRSANSLRQAENKIAALENSLQEKILQLNSYAENYSELEKAYTSYKKLSDTTKFALEGVFGAENSPISFLAGALHEGHLESLFDYVATSINNGAPQNEIEILRGLFDFAFDAANYGRREKIFTRLDTQAGIDFDNDEMRKTSDSAQSGTVKNVLLTGYKYSRTDKVIKPSLVFID